jgi:hypothetical protein
MVDLYKKINSIIGAPDYAVMFCLWPWPDGGWMAGVVLVDKEYALDQELLTAHLEEGDWDIKWDVMDGFSYPGVNAHGASSTPELAIDNLIDKLNLQQVKNV